jgi:radical SAM/Cys-rich protein
MDANEQLRLLSQSCRIPSFAEKVGDIKGRLGSKDINVLQINVGHMCNLTCRHCHVSAGPDRAETMSKSVLEKCLAVLLSHPIPAIDITGGSPEMNPHLGWFIDEAGQLNRRLIVRSNLTLLLENEYRHFIDVFARNRVEIFTSLPDYQEDKTNRQRGNGVFRRVINSIRALNSVGYGSGSEDGLCINIVHNPAGAYLPGSQSAIEYEYRRHLLADFGIHFNSLFCITNIPIGRYLDYLLETDNLEDYLSALYNSFNPCAVENVMCLNTLSVGWDGTLYDCDFNQMLGLTTSSEGPRNIMDFDIDKLRNRRITVNNHCYGCTAGAGSSCEGTLT